MTRAHPGLIPSFKGGGFFASSWCSGGGLCPLASSFVYLMVTRRLPLLSASSLHSAMSTDWERDSFSLSGRKCFPETPDPIGQDGTHAQFHCRGGGWAIWGPGVGLNNGTQSQGPSAKPPAARRLQHDGVPGHSNASVGCRIPDTCSRAPFITTCFHALYGDAAFSLGLPGLPYLESRAPSAPCTTSL